MEKIKFTDFSVLNFLSFINNAKIDSTAHSIDLKKDNVCCKAFPVDKRYVKYTSVGNQDIIRYESFPPNVSSIVIKVASIKKLENAMNVFKVGGIDKVSGEINFQASKVDKAKHHFCNDIVFRHQKTKIMVKCDDDSLIQNMPDAAWSLYSNTDNVIASFELDPTYVQQLQKLCDIDSQNAIIIKVDEDGVIFRSKNIGEEVNIWDLASTKNFKLNSGSKQSYIISKSVISDVLDCSNYVVNLTKIPGMNSELRAMVLFKKDDNNMLVTVANEEI